MASKKQHKATAASTSAPEAVPGAATPPSWASAPFQPGAGPQAAQKSQGEALAADVAQKQAPPAAEPEQAGKPAKGPMTVEELTEMEKHADRLKELISGAKHDRARKRPHSYDLKPVMFALDEVLEGMQEMVTALDWICEGAREDSAAYDRGPVRAAASIAKVMRTKLDPMGYLLHEVNHFDSIRLDVHTKDPHAEWAAEAGRIRVEWLADQNTVGKDAPDEDPRADAIDEIERKIASTTALTPAGLVCQLKLALRLNLVEQDFDGANLGAIEVQALRSMLGTLEAWTKPEAPDLPASVAGGQA